MGFSQVLRLRPIDTAPWPIPQSVPRPAASAEPGRSRLVKHDVAARPGVTFSTTACDALIRDREEPRPRQPQRTVIINTRNLASTRSPLTEPYIASLRCIATYIAKALGRALVSEPEFHFTAHWRRLWHMRRGSRIPTAVLV